MQSIEEIEAICDASQLWEAELWWNAHTDEPEEEEEEDAAMTPWDRVEAVIYVTLGLPAVAGMLAVAFSAREVARCEREGCDVDSGDQPEPRRVAARGPRAGLAGGVGSHELITCERCKHCVKGMGCLWCEVHDQEVEWDDLCAYGRRRDSEGAGAYERADN